MNHPRGRCAARPCYSHGMFCRWTACTCGSSEMIYGYLRWSPGWSCSKAWDRATPGIPKNIGQAFVSPWPVSSGVAGQKSIDALWFSFNVPDSLVAPPVHLWQTKTKSFHRFIYIYISFTFCCSTAWTWNGVNILSFSPSIFLSFCSGWPDLDKRDKCPRSRGIGSYVMQPNVT